MKKELNEKKQKKKSNILLYTIFMFIFFIFVQEIVIWYYGANTIYSAIAHYPKGSLVVSEAILASLCLILMLLFGNSYVFTQKKEKLKVGLFYGLFYIIGSIFFMLIFHKGFLQGPSLINLAIGCFFVGICEEFLCRGFLLNEFLERFGNTKKGIWYSIIISGLIFGLMHFGNVLNGQSIVLTFTQVFAASSTGIIFGLIYYKTKNIWSVIILHSLWDFSLMLNEIIPVTQSQETIPQFSIFSIIVSVLIAFIELMNLIPYVKDIDATPAKKKIIMYASISIILQIILLPINGLISLKMGKEYKYDNINIKEYSVTIDNLKKYHIKHNNLFFTLKVNEDGNLTLTNNTTKYSKKIDCENLIDYSIVEFRDYFIIAYIDYEKNSNPYLYFSYIYKDDMTNDNQYLDLINNSYKKYLLPDRSEIRTIYDYENNNKYLSTYNVDNGYLLLKDNKLSYLKD